MEAVGLMGLGIMGRAMAANIAKGGFDLTVYNRTPKKINQLREMMVTMAESPKELIDICDTIVIMVTGPEAIDTLLWSDSGGGSRLRPGKTIVNMSTVSPKYTRELAARVLSTGADFIDAPVSGSKKPAQDGTLVILAGGPEDKVKELSPLLLTMGKKVVHCGGHGTGTAMKMSVNLLLGTMLNGLAESLSFGRTMGLSKEIILETVLAGPLSCGLFELKETMFRSESYPTQFPLKHMLKDLRFALEAGYDSGAQTPVGHAVIQAYAKAQSLGLGDEDFAAVLESYSGDTEK